jgi:hypothetical protein
MYRDANRPIERPETTRPQAQQILRGIQFDSLLMLILNPMLESFSGWISQQSSKCARPRPQTTSGVGKRAADSIQNE